MFPYSNVSVRLIILSIIVLIIITFQPIDAKEINCNNFDDLFNDFTIVSSPRRRFPTNGEEFSAYCKKNHELGNIIGQTIKTCFNETMKNIASLMLYSYRSRTKTLCKNRNSKRAKELMASAPCLNQHQSKISKCIIDSAYRIGAAHHKPNHLKFPYLCCESVNFLKCVDKIQAGECKSRVLLFANSAQSIMNGFVDQTCGDYNAETDKCDQLLPLTIKKESTKPSLAKNAAILIASIEP